MEDKIIADVLDRYPSLNENYVRQVVKELIEEHKDKIA